MLNETGDAPKPIAMPGQGTTIIVRDLFYNNP